MLTAVSVVLLVLLECSWFTGSNVSLYPENDLEFSSNYERICCQERNFGENVIEETADGAAVSIVMCPATRSLEDCPSQNNKNSSCYDIFNNYPNVTSGYYDITVDNGSVVSVYCDMEGESCDGEGGWTRVGYLDMSETNATCPTGLELLELNNKTRGCHYEDYFYSSCSHSIVYSTIHNYTKVCGRARGYCLGTCVAFWSSFDYIDSAYVDGISITRGSPRKHVWTFAAGHSEYGQQEILNCPCNNGSSETTPLFVGDDYFCEAAGDDWTEDPLWDAMDCNHKESSCCLATQQLSHFPPWFMKTLDEETDEYIEVRLCDPYHFFGSTLELIEIFVK